MVLIPSLKYWEHGLQLARDYWSQAHRKWLTGQIWQKKLAWNLTIAVSYELKCTKKKNKIGVTFSYKRLHFGNVCSQLNFLKLLESCHFNTNAGGGFLKILKGKKWDQIKRRDVELVDKKNTSETIRCFHLQSMSFSAKKWHCTLLGFSL